MSQCIDTAGQSTEPRQALAWNHPPNGLRIRVPPDRGPAASNASLRTLVPNTPVSSPPSAARDGSTAPFPPEALSPSQARRRKLGPAFHVKRPRRRARERHRRPTRTTFPRTESREGEEAPGCDRYAGIDKAASGRRDHRFLVQGWNAQIAGEEPSHRAGGSRGGHRALWTTSPATPMRTEGKGVPTISFGRRRRKQRAGTGVGAHMHLTPVPASEGKLPSRVAWRPPGIATCAGGPGRRVPSRRGSCSGPRRKRTRRSSAPCSCRGRP